MKTKKFKRKLALKKETISNLDNGLLSHVKGGCASERQSCPLTTLTEFHCPPTQQYPNTNCTCATCPGQDSCSINACEDAQ